MAETTTAAAPPAGNAHIVTAVKRLADARRASLAATTAVEQALAHFKQDHQVILTTQEGAKKECAEAEAQLRELTVAHFKVTGDKRVGPGVNVKLNTTVEYDSGRALEYAMQKGVALKLDAEPFERLAMAQPSLFPWVKIAEVPVATVAKDLDKALEVGP